MFCLLLQSSSTASIQALQMGSLPFLVVSFTLRCEADCSVEQWVLLPFLISWRTTRHVALMLCLVLILGRLGLCSLFLSPKDTLSKFSLGRSWLYSMHAQTVMQQLRNSMYSFFTGMLLEVCHFRGEWQTWSLPSFFSLCSSSVCVSTDVHLVCDCDVLLKTPGFISLSFSLVLDNL